MKSIYILLTKSGTILSRFVHFITADPYTHASIAFDSSLQPLYSSSRKNGVTIFPAGPCAEHLHRGYYLKHSHIPCVLYELKVSDEVYFAAKKEAERIVGNSAEYHFNIVGLVLCHLKIPFVRRHHYFCSQFVSEILIKSEAMKLPKAATLMKPADYMQLSELRCLYRGQLKDLRRIVYKDKKYAKASPVA